MVGYVVKKTDGGNLVVIQQETQDDTTTSITLLGKLKTDYGLPLNENFIHLLENFASRTAPHAPLEGQIWYDKNTKSLKVFNGTFFVGLESATINGITSSDMLLADNNLSDLTNVAAARTSLDVYSKSEVATAFVSSNGGTITGSLSINGNPTAANHAVTKQYVDNHGWYEIPASVSTPSTFYENGCSGFIAPSSPDQPSDNQTGITVMAGHGTQGFQVSSNWKSGTLHVRTKNDNTSAWGAWRELAWADNSIKSSGGTITSLEITTTPTLPTHATTKQYVDQMLPLAGGSMTGSLYVQGDPAQPLEVANKGYVDTNFINKTGGSMTGALILSGDPVGSLQATTKQYVDLKTSSSVSKNGDTMTGALILSGDPAYPLQAVTKQYADRFVLASGGTITGQVILVDTPTEPMGVVNRGYVDNNFLSLQGGMLQGSLVLRSDPVSQQEAATKNYVDNKTANALLKTGDTMLGTLSLRAAPTDSSHAVSKAYADLMVPLSGGTMSGPLSLSGQPTLPTHAASKDYVDSIAGSFMTTSGGTLTGSLFLNSDPTQSLEAATKNYVDSKVGNFIQTTGGTVTGSLYVTKVPVSQTEVTNKEYVDTLVSNTDASTRLMITGEYVPLTGATMTGKLELAENPIDDMEAATKHYVDTTAANYLPLSGGTFAESFTVTPTTDESVANRKYVDDRDGALKNYVDAYIITLADAVTGYAVPLQGGTMTGELILSSNPTNALGAVPKQYVDNRTITIAGDVTGSGTTSISVSLPQIGTAGTYSKITTDSKGRVISGSPLSETDIPSLSWSKLTSTPTSIGGYGITDAYTTTQINTALALKADKNQNISLFANDSGYQTAANVTTAIANKADKATSLNGYGITDAVSINGTQTLTSKTINLSSNTLTGTIAQFNTALSDGDFVTKDASGGVNVTVASTYAYTANQDVIGGDRTPIALTVHNTDNTASYSGIELRTRTNSCSAIQLINEYKSAYQGDFVIRTRTVSGQSAERLRIDTNGNVTIGGSLTAGTISGTLSRPTINGYTEKVTSASTSGSYTIDMTTANVFNITLTGNTSFSMSGVPANGISGSINMIITQDTTGGHTVSWPSNVLWPSGTAPNLTTTANAIDVVTLFTVNGGTYWLGAHSMGNCKAATL